MAQAKRTESGGWRTLACKQINGKKIRKSFTVHPKDCGGDSRKAKSKSEALARDWVLNEELEQNYITVQKAIDEYINTIQVS